MIPFRYEKPADADAAVALFGGAGVKNTTLAHRAVRERFPMLARRSSAALPARSATWRGSVAT
jgi:CO/xanthine dehydrogenase FAD-binding subunit